MRLILVMSVLLAAVGPLAAQSSETIYAEIRVASVASISVDQAEIVFPTPTAADYEAGFVDAIVQPRISHFSNTPHTITVSALQPVLTAPLGARPVSADAIRWQRGGFATNEPEAGIPLSTTAVAIHDVVSAGRYEYHDDLRYRFRLQPANLQGRYSIPVIYTIVAQ